MELKFLFVLGSILPWSWLGYSVIPPFFLFMPARAL